MNGYIKVYSQSLETVEAHSVLDINLHMFLVSQSILHDLVANFCIFEIIAFSDVVLHFGRTLHKPGK